MTEFDPSLLPPELAGIDRDNCPIMRSLGVLGDPWSLFILREFFLDGPRKFKDLETSLKVSPNTLSTRLKKLEEHGVLKKRFYSSHPPRADYVLTEKGQAVGPILLELLKWGETFA
ncbi:putative HTH-type transcriptional regulator YybR [Pseudovibrio sp. Ad5]|uniref:winged helix-turn-helix transcriptional regulator n=1 Tax=Pseudovibrio sp. Ad5 TaxID=989436 RepID=UPI0007AE80DA|nr:helix-turn-helix domain-containing protein [Pseudovibrio sp. Ad5]KZK89577.1 putative HTH-type transcriptional regulator YybR [Pseudovibrio sp. Ad5]